MRTPSQTIGPFFRGKLLEQPIVFEDGDARIEGRVFDGEGVPVDDALVEIWQPEVNGFGRCATGPDGAFHFRTQQTPHANVVVFARGLLRHLVTRMYFSQDEVPSELTDRRDTLLARREGDVWRFDVHLQDPKETAFLDV
jgi:protocatechuate 3,4-dioxygenase alpha subunit